MILDDLYQYETHVIWTLVRRTSRQSLVTRSVVACVLISMVDCFVYMIQFMLTCQNFPNFRMCNLTFFLFSLNDYFLFVCTTRLLASNLLMARQDSSCFSSRSCCSTMLKFCSYLMSSLIFKMRPRVCLHFFSLSLQQNLMICSISNCREFASFFLAATILNCFCISVA